MEATKPAAKPAQHLPVDSEPVAAIDPEHEIDAKKTVTWLSACLVFVVVCLWALGLVYDFTTRQAQKEKVDDIPPRELQALRAGEDAAFANRKTTAPVEGDGRSLAEIEASIGKHTDEIIRNYVK